MPASLREDEDSAVAQKALHTLAPPAPLTWLPCSLPRILLFGHNGPLASPRSHSCLRAFALALPSVWKTLPLGTCMAPLLLQVFTQTSPSQAIALALTNPLSLIHLSFSQRPFHLNELTHFLCIYVLSASSQKNISSTEVGFLCFYCVGGFCSLYPQHLV